MSSLNKPLLFVFGNHHAGEKRYFGSGTLSWDDSSKEFHGSGAVHVGSKVKIEEGMIIAGLGGSMRYNRGENQYTEWEMYLEIFRLIPRLLWNRLFHGRYADILLTHAPPRGIHDKPDKCHWGFKAFLWFMKVFKPAYLIHGHIHLYDLADVRRTQWGQTSVINAYSHCIIDSGEGIKNEQFQTANIV